MAYQEFADLSKNLWGRIGADTDYLVITQAATIRSCVLSGNLKLERMAQVINAQDFDGMDYTFLVSADGKILAHPDKQ
ncbi:hypothetical protein [Pseudomonas sp. A014]|uniref:hypothetical protein n=1 Tax=Pseudomonas sp. A014 TaxID=3458058 RepID=UPI004035051E